ncbi:hypothetical protein N657DRAFT_279757 [Parathielavia appendiculata]|uniref:Uncharacterized protein n=1 Tax=Parathielavia appendiculata TaxID=2587402 RepID=A0AAN6U3K2_9PEZI|nr:hypothetical protein N657DRAFT_279757 [Parathielavia appendiculata]
MMIAHPSDGAEIPTPWGGQPLPNGGALESRLRSVFPSLRTSLELGAPSSPSDDHRRSKPRCETTSQSVLTSSLSQSNELLSGHGSMNNDETSIQRSAEHQEWPSPPLRPVPRATQAEVAFRCRPFSSLGLPVMFEGTFTQCLHCRNPDSMSQKLPSQVPTTSDLSIRTDPLSSSHRDSAHQKV